MGTQDFGILYQLAPDLGVGEWRGAAGQPLEDYGLAAMPGRYKLLFCFQDNCPGCHRHGFPTLIKLFDAFRRSPTLSLAAIQTVFEDFESNTAERGFANQQRYALPIPFGHDAGADGRGSTLIARYRSGGTPWFILIDPEGIVRFNHFHLDAERLIEFLHHAAAEAPAPADIPTWSGVLRQLRDGNPPPPRRVELTEEEWQQRLSPEQFRITRQHGTEAAFSSPLCALFAPGRYACAGCGSEIFDATAKFDSGSGWPSFTQAIAANVLAYVADDSHGMQRVETRCNICDAHLGHVFPDGPPPGGLRYCINALALVKRD